MKELIEKKVLDRDWTFNEISNLNETVAALSQDIYSEMTLIEKFKLIQDLRIKDDYVGAYFEDVVKLTVMTVLNGEIAQTIKQLLNGATINFGGNKNEISERSMGGKPHKERTSNEKKSSLSEE
tara:strand:+ start:3435 stop:3806 length:372 start_codon:yes stop_codon:yes gene_type:complete